MAEVFFATAPHLPAHHGPITIQYEFSRPDKRKRDLFNYEKALTDFLVKQGVMDDDSQIIEGTLRWLKEPVILMGCHVVEIVIRDV